jgi:hypothetical protein
MLCCPVYSAGSGAVPAASAAAAAPSSGVLDMFRELADTMMIDSTAGGFSSMM